MNYEQSQDRAIDLAARISVMLHGQPMAAAVSAIGGNLAMLLQGHEHREAMLNEIVAHVRAYWHR